MENLFLTMLNMSVTAGYLVIAVVILRFALKKAPKWLHCLLWGLVGVRLLCPVSLESVVSLIPSAEIVSPDIVYSPVPTISSGIYALNQTINPLISSSLAPNIGDSVNPMQVVVGVAAVVWIAGIAAMLVYMAVSYIRLKHQVQTAVLLEKNVWQSENVASPFILGVIKPRIYLPFDMTEADRANVLAHENAHLGRHDHWIKPIAFLLLAAYWFNPLMWLAYVLLCRDIELACDERVVRNMNAAGKRGYSSALLSCSVSRKRLSACPLAFGEGNVRGRIKNVLNYKKPAFWIVVVAVAACIVVAVCFLTNPMEEQDLSFLNDENAVALAGEQDTVSVVYYPVTADGSGSICPGYAKGNKFAAFLDGVAWTEIDAPRSAPPSSGSIDFILNDDYRIALYDSKQYVCVTSDGSVRWYKAAGEDYESAVALFVDNYRHVVSGGSVIPALVYTDDMSLEDIKKEVFWLSCSPSDGVTTPFDVYIDGQKQYGQYGIYDAESFEALEFMHPSGLAPQTYILQNAEPGHSYIVTIDGGSERICFGITLPVLNTLSLNDVIMLSGKGEELTWADFEGYAHIDTGSGLYINKFDIDTQYSLWIGGVPEGLPMYIRLLCNVDEEYIDIRTDDVTEFIQAHAGHRSEGLAHALTVGAAYVPAECLYVNPISALSSFAPIDGDSGCRYLVNENGFSIENRDSGQQQSFVVNWEWQAVPWSDEEWAALYPAEMGITNISELYDEMLYQPVGDGYSLLKMDGEIWLVDVKDIKNMGEQLWSIFTLVPEGSAG